MALNQMSGWRETARMWLLAGLFLSLAAAGLACRSLGQNITDDERRFLSAGAVAASEGRWPVLHMPFFEWPGLAMVYAGVFAATDGLMLPGRALSVLAAATAAGLLMLAAAKRMDALTGLGRFGLAAGAAVLLLTCPVFLRETGRATPGDLAAAGVLGSLMAAMAAVRQSSQRRAAGLAAAAGLAIGLAAGVDPRLAPVAVLLLLTLLFAPRLTPRRKWTEVAAYSAAVLAAAAPIALLYRRTPEVLAFATADLPLKRWFSAGTFDAHADLVSPTQLSMLRSLVVDPVMLVLIAAFTGLAALALAVLWRSRGSKKPALLLVEIILALTATLAVAAAGYVTQPTTASHLFAALPLAVLSCVLCAAYVRRHGGERARLAATTFYIGAVLAAIVPGVQGWIDYLTAFEYSQTPVARHLAAADRIRSAVTGGYVLTLDPLTALEAGGRVYPALVLGEQGWRWSASMSSEQRDRLGLIAPSQLGRLVQADPPEAVMVRSSPTRAESPFMSYARYHGFRKAALGTGYDLWTPDDARAAAVATHP